MVAHGNALKGTRVAEWADAYINYSRLTDSLDAVTKKVHKRIKSEGRLPPEGQLDHSYPAEVSQTRIILNEV